MYSTKTSFPYVGLLTAIIVIKSRQVDWLCFQWRKIIPLYQPASTLLNRRSELSVDVIVSCISVKENIEKHFSRQDNPKVVEELAFDVSHS